jgi:hypothetical protein
VLLTQTEGFEALQGAGKLLDKPVVLLNRVVEVFDLPDLDQPEPSIQQQEQPVDVLQSCQVRAALVDTTFSGQPLFLIVRAKKALAAASSQYSDKHEIKGFAEFVDSPIEIGPLAFDLDIGLVHPPGAAGCGFAPLGLAGNQGRIFHDPSVQRSASRGQR